MARKAVYNSPEDVGFNPTGGTSGGGYDNIETEVSRVDNGDGTFTVTYRGSTDPNAPTYTKLVGTKRATAAPPDFAAASALYDKVGSRVTGKIQDYIKEVHDGMLSGKYSIADAVNAFQIVDIQRDQGFTGLEGSPSVDDKVDVSSIYDLYNTVGARVTGSVQTYLDEIFAGAKTGKYSISDVQNAFNTVNLQADQGMTGAYGAAQGVVAVDPGTGGGNGAGAGVPGKDARATIKALLSTYKLDEDVADIDGKFGSLADYIYKIIGSGEVNINNPDAILYSIRKHPTYERRFSANKVRVANGFDELDPASYIGLEDQYRETLSANGMPVSFYDSKNDFDALIGGSVSNAELQSRVQDGYRAVQDADPEVKRQMYALGFAEGDLAAYFIDPNRMRPTLVAADYKRQAEAAKIAARGLQSAGIQLSGGLAEDLARRGVTETQAQTGFTAIGKLGELTTQMGGETALSQEQIVGQQFGTDTQAALELEKRRRRRVGEFAGGGSFARTQGETSGSITTSVGKAQ
jgi:hypothetical protein